MTLFWSYVFHKLKCRVNFDFYRNHLWLTQIMCLKSLLALQKFAWIFLGEGNRVQFFVSWSIFTLGVYCCLSLLTWFFALSCVCVCVCVFSNLLSHVRLFVIPCDCSPPGSSVHGILLARILEWVATPSLQGIFPTQGSNLHLFYLLHWQVGSLALSPPGKPQSTRMD